MKKLFSLFFLNFCFMLFGPLSAMQNGQQAQLNRQLLQAAETGNLKQVQELVRSGADVNTQDNLGETPLHWAAGQGHELVVDALLRNKAAVNIQNTSGITPLHYAAFEGHLPIVQLLLVHGADATIEDNQNLTALDEAHNQGHQAIEQLIHNHLQSQELAQPQISPEPEFGIS